MVPPLISYVTFNRLGLTVKNLSSILDSTDDFELHIIDNNSTDGTWKYIQSLNDRRIKSRIQIGVNSGPIYALNLNLSKRKPDQYFITVDNDVYIETKDWITRFMKVFETFPEVGLLGVQRGQPYPEELLLLSSKYRMASIILNWITLILTQCETIYPDVVCA
ncbi:glycosyltransferase family 2 protein [Clostridium botulinum]|nr:glycosyltransferase family 2 protein [Clostridium botulinum]